MKGAEMGTVETEDFGASLEEVVDPKRVEPAQTQCEERTRATLQWVVVQRGQGPLFRGR
jgi:hypothetical protein